MKLFYARCSTQDQNEARQLQAAAENDVDQKHIYLDKLSGKTADRPKLQEMLAFAREGDVIIVSELARLARSTRDLLRITDELKTKRVELQSLKENIDTRTPQGQFMLTVFGALAELERETILQRQREGIELRKAAGGYKGRTPIPVDREKFAAVCKRWRAGEITAVEAQALTGLKANTFYRRVKSFGL